MRAGRETFAVPMVDVAEVIRVDRAALPRSNVLLVRGTAVSVLDLGEVLGLGAGRPEQGAGYLLILAESRGGTGFVVDQVLGRQEVVIKTVGSLLNRVAAFSGATIMGDGSVVLILDLPVLVRVALDRLAPAARAS
ncbi:MAG: chemotaxis protein CheW [Candidatus Rokubacteria bacterium]|nr:chemotaxis protein CheW [Candidatus Rokubacteria bacterium]